MLTSKPPTVNPCKISGVCASAYLYGNILADLPIQRYTYYCIALQNIFKVA